jgi:hypothetical protein
MSSVVDFLSARICVAPEVVRIVPPKKAAIEALKLPL